MNFGNVAAYMDDVAKSAAYVAPAFLLGKSHQSDGENI
jgi:hypothetical protein